MVATEEDSGDQDPKEWGPGSPAPTAHPDHGPIHLFFNVTNAITVQDAVLHLNSTSHFSLKTELNSVGL